MTKNAVLIEVKSPEGNHEHEFYNLPRLATPILARELQDVDYGVTQYFETFHEPDYRAFKADLVGISTVSHSVPRGYEIARQIKENSPETLIVMGGPHVTFMPDEGIENGIDIVVRGEGEGQLKTIARALSEHGKDEAVSRFRQGEFTPGSFDLSQSVLPDFESIYLGGKELAGLPIQTSRGCAHPCTNCQVPALYGREYRTKPIELVVRELEQFQDLAARGYLHKYKNKYSLMVIDDNSAHIGYRARTLDLWRRLKAEGLLDNINWMTQARVDTIKQEDVLETFAETGCIKICYGIEAVYNAALRKMKKGIDTETVNEAIRRTKDLGIQVHGLFMIGFDSDTYEDIMEIPEFCVESGINGARVSILTPFPGTTLHERLSGDGRIIDTDPTSYDFTHVVHQPSGITPDKLMQAYHEVRRQLSAIPNFFVE